jgi:CubicO group peptidase (beta-lactamase class C family)
LARLAELQRNGGTHDGQQILSREWIRSSVTPRTAIPGTEWEYGYLWWLKSYPVGDSTYLAQAMNGNGGNRIMILPEFGVTVVITKTDYNSQDMHSKTDAFFDDEIFARLSTE